MASLRVVSYLNLRYNLFKKRMARELLQDTNYSSHSTPARHRSFLG